MAFAAGAEGVTGHHGHPLVVEQIGAELLTAGSKAADAGEHIEGAFRHEAVEAQIGEGLVEIQPTLVELFPHIFDVGDAFGDGFQARWDIPEAHISLY